MTGPVSAEILGWRGKWRNHYCPFCGSDNLWIDDTTGAGHCFSCGQKAGDAKLRKLFGDLWFHRSERNIARPIREPEIDIDAARDYLTRIWDSLPHDATRKGIDHHRFKLVLSQTLTARIESDLSQSDCLKMGFKRKDDDGYRWVGALKPDRICIPYFRDGKVVSIRTRGEGIRYLNIKGWPGTFWGEARDPIVIVTEGEFKAMRLEQLGYNALAIPGISSSHEELAGYLKTKRVTHALIWFDVEPQPDHPVTQQQNRLARKLNSFGIGAATAQFLSWQVTHDKVDVEDIIDWLGPLSSRILIDSMLQRTFQESHDIYGVDELGEYAIIEP